MRESPIGESQMRREFNPEVVRQGLQDNPVLGFGSPFAQEKQTYQITVNSLAPIVTVLVGRVTIAAGPTQEFPTGHVGLHPVSWGPKQQLVSITETITPAAEKFARSLGLYGSLVLTRQIVREKMGPAMTALYMDRNEDPDEGGYPTICFRITTRESVDQMLERDNTLQESLIDRIPASDCLHFSFAYQFE